ncbi:long-chain N-acyl amino acid synthase [Nitrosomonas sp. H1_AOB3]|uniref:N-acyl amino acid synthase FeeM domain-containing protein n=1 Tax=Nitrosomonas sp. H1_AOB3 TaxID=2741553 RepID=UPI001938D7E0|nr:long-chain N-acyl amino acid synthase [Nitrosomonas sp. H1_AOB3]QOJ10296.1 MAG: long-chain N-acyl amino acid synthase [Nitrosomonas sp. H1_AOB3]
MQIANHLQSGTAAKNIQPVHIPFNSYQPDSTSSDDTNSESLRSRKYRISRHPDNNPNHATETDCLLQRNGYSIHLVNSLKQRIKASTLIKRMYASRGYNTESTSVFSHNPNEFTFLATIGDITAGTVTLRTDSETGLLADKLYYAEIDHFRKKGGRVCEISKFAINPEFSSKEMTASLFQIMYVFACHINQTTDFFCEVNPRHAIPQKRMFGFRQIGEAKTCSRVNAPAVLLHLNAQYIEEQIAGIEKHADQSRRSLYPYFFSPHKEKKIIQFIEASKTTFASDEDKNNSLTGTQKYLQSVNH